MNNVIDLSDLTNTHLEDVIVSTKKDLETTQNVLNLLLKEKNSRLQDPNFKN